MEQNTETPSQKVLNFLTAFFNKKLEASINDPKKLLSTLKSFLPAEICSRMVKDLTTKSVMMKKDENLRIICEKVFGVQVVTKEKKTNVDLKEIILEDKEILELSSELSVIPTESSKEYFMKIYIEKKRKENSLLFNKKEMSILERVSEFMSKTCIEWIDNTKPMKDVVILEDEENSFIPNQTLPNVTINEKDIQTNRITLIDHLKYFTPEVYCFLNNSVNTVVELTSQLPITIAILEYALQNKSRFQFQTPECLQLGYILLESFSKYGIKEKHYVFGDRNIRILTDNNIHPYLLFLESQRKECNEVILHKDFEKICLTCRTSLKYTILQIKKTKGYIPSKTKLSCFAILSCPSRVFILRMDCENYRKQSKLPNEIDNQTFRFSFTLHLISTIDLKTNAQSILIELYKIFKYGEELILEFGGHKCTRISTTPLETFSKEQYSGVKYESIENKFIQTDKSYEQIVEMCKSLMTMKHPQHVEFVTRRGATHTEINSILSEYPNNLIYFMNETDLQIVQQGIDNKIIIIVENNIQIYLVLYKKIIQKRQYDNTTSLTIIEQGNSKKVKESDDDTLLKDSSTLNNEFVQTLSSADIPNNSITFLNKFNITSLDNSIRRELNPSEGVSIYFNGCYLNKQVFVKITCYKSYRENVKCMNYLKNVKSKYLNEIIKYEQLNFQKSEIMEIFSLTSDQFDYLKLQDVLYLTILSPVSIWYNYFISNYNQIYPLNNLQKCKTIVLLILKLFIDNLKGLKELHSHNIAHVDFNILNSNILLDTKNSTLDSTDLINNYLKDNHLPKFNMVLIDFNSSRIQSQELFSKYYIPKSTHFPSDYKLVIETDEIPIISFTIAHDIYSLSIVMIQYIDILLTCYSTSCYLMKHFIIKYINQSHDRKKESTHYNIYNVMKYLKEKLNNLMLGNETLINTFNELFEIITSMNQDPWKCINEFNYYFEKLNSLLILVEKL